MEGFPVVPFLSFPVGIVELNERSHCSAPDSEGGEGGRDCSANKALKGRLWSKLWPPSPRSPLGFVSPAAPQSASSRVSRKSWPVCLILFGTWGNLFLPFPFLLLSTSPIAIVWWGLGKQAIGIALQVINRPPLRSPPPHSLRRGRRLPPPRRAKATQRLFLQASIVRKRCRLT